jgi:hypothetical protein
MFYFPRVSRKTAESYSTLDSQPAISEAAKRKEERSPLENGGEGGIRTHGTVPRTLAFEASTFNRSVTSPRSWQVPS